MNRIVKLIISIAIPLLAGTGGAFFTVTGVNTWYPTIAKPSWNPPNYVFGPVWTTLYILMGIALFLIWTGNNNQHEKRISIAFFCIQLLFNFLWSFIFFQQHAIGLALADIILLWILILITIFRFSTFSRLAAWLLVPYISWVSFAACLNYAIWKLN